jgi:hypothetical protein
MPELDGYRLVERVRKDAPRATLPPKHRTPQRGPATILCWGVFPRGLLRHPVVVS